MRPQTFTGRAEPDNADAPRVGVFSPGANNKYCGKSDRGVAGTIILLKSAASTAASINSCPGKYKRASGINGRKDGRRGCSADDLVGAVGGRGGATSVRTPSRTNR